MNMIACRYALRRRGIASGYKRRLRLFPERAPVANSQLPRDGDENLYNQNNTLTNSGRGVLLSLYIFSLPQLLLRGRKITEQPVVRVGKPFADARIASFVRVGRL